MSKLAPIGAALLGASLTGLIVVALGMPADEAALLALYAAVAAVIAGALGSLALRALSHRSMGLQIAVVSLTSVAAVAAGAVSAANQMFISSHDLRALVVVLSAAGAVGATGALMLGRRVARASRWLGASAGLIAEGKEPVDPSHPVSEELRSVAIALKDMSQRLDESRERERAMERSRRELVAWVSHDLRTPLAGIRAMAEALEDGMASDDVTASRYHRTLRVETDRLAGLVDDLFELSRINAGNLRLELESVSLGDLVSDALSAAAGVARAGGVRLDGRLATETLELEASAPEIARVISNLLENAIHHTPAEGVVTVEAGAQKGHAYVAVADACGGIPDSDLDRVFDVAFRGQQARTPGERVRGGLGLAIARGIVDAHGGDIQVRNVDSGCLFTVRLPLHRT
ncbi:MAG: ATP-binding protein [Actinomycetota bacterium]|nr:ATP-binding protein [Actinomycetota bacterium]